MIHQAVHISNRVRGVKT